MKGRELRALLRVGKDTGPGPSARDALRGRRLLWAANARGVGDTDVQTSD